MLTPLREGCAGQSRAGTRRALMKELMGSTSDRQFVAPADRRPALCRRAHGPGSSSGAPAAGSAHDLAEPDGGDEWRHRDSTSAHGLH